MKELVSERNLFVAYLVDFRLIDVLDNDLTVVLVYFFFEEKIAVFSLCITVDEIDVSAEVLSDEVVVV